MARNKLLFVRHAMPVIDPARAPDTWPLSDEGRDATRAFAAALADLAIDTIVSSEEPKCTGTATALAGELGLPWSTAPELHEHRRGAMDWHGEEDWHALLRRFFDHPDELVFGAETARETLERFTSAVESVLQQSPASDGTLCIVSHGTVISLYVGRVRGVPPYSIWKDLKLPDYVELEVG